jgi:hypothetical protein
LPILGQILQDPKTTWKKTTIRDWYGEKCRQIEIVSRTAVWYHSGMPPLPIRWVLIRDPQGEFRSQALLCTDLTVDPVQIVKWFVMRWQLEVTFQEVRTHLGVETQRQWSDWAIARTTPALLGLFSLVTLFAHYSTRRGRLPIRQAAWYDKPLPSFSDAMGVVRHQLWRAMSFHTSESDTEMQKVPRLLVNRFIDALCYAT